jgi:hypothetical protein
MGGARSLRGNAGAARTLAAVLRALRLPADERRLAAEAGIQLTRASLELRLRRSSRLTSLLGTLEDVDHPVDETELHEALRVGRTVARVAGRLPGAPTCLPRALATQRMLRRRGIASRLHLGVTNSAEERAHAWVTVDGQAVVGGAGVERFVPLAAFA